MLSLTSLGGAGTVTGSKQRWRRKFRQSDKWRALGLIRR